MTADRKSDKPCTILLFLLLQSRDLGDGGNWTHFAKVTTFEILLTFHGGISRKKVVTFEILYQFLWNLTRW